MKIKKSTLKKIIAEEYARKRVRDLLQETFMDRVKIHTNQFIEKMGRGASNIYNFLTMQTPIKIKAERREDSRGNKTPIVNLSIDFRELPVLRRVGEREEKVFLSLSAYIHIHDSHISIANKNNIKAVYNSSKVPSSIPVRDYEIIPATGQYSDSEMGAEYNPRDIALGLDKEYGRQAKHFNLPKDNQAQAIGDRFAPGKTMDYDGVVNPGFRSGTSNNLNYTIPLNRVPKECILSKDKKGKLNFDTSDEAVQATVMFILERLLYIDSESKKTRPLLGINAMGNNRYTDDIRFNVELSNRLKK